MAGEAIKIEESIYLEYVDDVESYPALYLVEDDTADIEEDLVQLPLLIDADTIPELRFIRQRATEEALKKLEDNRQLLRDGEFNSVPIPVDPLGTANHVVEIKERYGEDSQEYKESFRGLLLDSERLIGEAYRKNTWEYFGPSEQKLDPLTDLYMSHGIPVLGITERGLSPIAEPEEVDRRINDHVAEYTNHMVPRIRALGNTALKGTVTARSISECADWAIDAYKKDPDSKASYGGLVPAIEKLMIGDIKFKESDDREQTQVALPGLFINHEVITTVLNDQSLTKQELHRKQYFGQEELIVFVQRLDEEASRMSCKNIFMGEEVPEDYQKDYDAIPQEAEDRRLRLAPKPLELTNYLISLAENKTDRWAVEPLVDKFLKQMMLEVAAKNPEQAAIIFDKPTADGFREVARLKALGLNEQANKLSVVVGYNAPAVTFCGAGSCGLEAVKPGSLEAAMVSKLGLVGEYLLHDTERGCHHCGKMTVYYDMAGGKACANPDCHKKDIKNS